MTRTFSRGNFHGALVSQRRAARLNRPGRPEWNEDDYDVSTELKDETARAEARARADAIWEN